MSKLDNDIKAVIDDMTEQAQTLLPKLLAVMADDDLDEEKMQAKLASIMEESKPKTYDVYIHDIKQAFRNDGWIEPPTNKSDEPMSEAEQKSYMCALGCGRFMSANALQCHIEQFHIGSQTTHPVDGELREQLKHIASFKFGPFKNTVPAKILLMPADNDYKSNGIGMHWSYDDFIDEVCQLFATHLQAAVREAEIKARINTLQWCAEQENDELDNLLDEYEDRLKAELNSLQERSR